MADDEEAVVLACTSLVFCALDLRQSREQLLRKSEVDIPTQVHAVATPLNTCRASRACRDERVALCNTSRQVSSRHVTTFPYAKMHGLACRHVT